MIDKLTKLEHTNVLGTMQSWDTCPKAIPVDPHYLTISRASGNSGYVATIEITDRQVAEYLQRKGRPASSPATDDQTLYETNRYVVTVRRLVDRNSYTTNLLDLNGDCLVVASVKAVSIEKAYSSSFSYDHPAKPPRWCVHIRGLGCGWQSTCFADRNTAERLRDTIKTKLGWLEAGRESQ